MTTKVHQIKGTEIDINSVKGLRSGQTFGWLRKKTRKFFVPRYQARFFTVDFETRMLYYSHGEFGKKVSTPIPFCDILDVESLTSKNDEDGSDRPTGNKSCLPRLGKDEQHDFVLYAKGEHKYLELRCSSASACDKWIATFQSAMLLHKDDASKACKDDVDSDQSTRTCSRGSYDGSLSRESSMTNGWEQNSEGHGSDGIPDQMEVDHAVELPFCKVPQSSIAEPGRCLSTSSASNDSPSPFWQLDAKSETEPVGSPFCLDSPDFSKYSLIQGDTFTCKGADDKEDLQALLIDAVLSSSTCPNTWKRPQQPVIDKHPQPRKDSPVPQEDCKGMLPTIQEDAAEDEADKSPPFAKLSFRERLIARGKGPIPHDIKIP